MIGLVLATILTKMYRRRDLAPFRSPRSISFASCCYNDRQVSPLNTDMQCSWREMKHVAQLYIMYMGIYMGIYIWVYIGPLLNKQIEIRTKFALLCLFIYI